MSFLHLGRAKRALQSKRCNSHYLLLNLFWLLVLSATEILCLTQAAAQAPLVPALVQNRNHFLDHSLSLAVLSQAHMKLSLLYCNFLVLSAAKEKQNHIYFCIFFLFMEIG